MKKGTLIVSVLAAAILTLIAFGVPAKAITVLFPIGGGTGRSTFTASQLLYGNGTNALSSVATTTLTGTAPITFSNAISVIGSVASTISCAVASGSQPGCLASADWTTFNNKQAAGNYLTALTGDVTATGPGSVAATLATVNADVGSFTNANVTVNGKGLVTAVSNGSAGGSGSVATSTNETSGTLAYWTSTNGTPALLGKVATSTLTGGSQVAVSNSPVILGTAGAVLSVVADSIGDTQLAFNTGQALTTASSPTFAGLTLSSPLTVANGGTGSTTLSGILRGNGTGQVSTLVVGSGLTFNGTTLAVDIANFVTSIIAGDNISISGATGAVTIDAIPEGNDTEIQYNNAGVFGAEPAFTYAPSTNVLTVDEVTSNGATALQLSGQTGLQIDSLGGDMNVRASGELFVSNDGGSTRVGLNTGLQTVDAPIISFPDTAGVSDTFCFETLANCASGGGSGTVSSGTRGQLGYYAADGTTISGTSSLAFAYDSGTYTNGTLIGNFQNYTTGTLIASGTDFKFQSATSTGGIPTGGDFFINAGDITLGGIDDWFLSDGAVAGGLSIKPGDISGSEISVDSAGLLIQNAGVSSAELNAYNTSLGATSVYATSSDSFVTGIFAGGLTLSAGDASTDSFGASGAVMNFTAPTIDPAGLATGGSVRVIPGSANDVSGSFIVRNAGDTLDALFVQGSTGRVGIGSSTPYGALSVESDSVTNPIFAFATSSGNSYGGIMTGWATTTTQTNVTSLNLPETSGARVFIGSLLSYAQLAFNFTQLYINGWFDQSDSQTFCDSPLGPTALSADGANPYCTGFWFGEDGTGTFTANAGNGYTFGQLTATAANDGAGLFAAGASTGWITIASTTPIFATDARISSIQLATSTHAFYIGFMNLATGGTAYEVAPTQGCYITASSTQANWQAVSRNSATNITQTNTQVASSTVLTGISGFKRFYIVADENNCQFFIQDGQANSMRLVADHSTNLPTSSLNAGVYMADGTVGQGASIDIKRTRFWWREFLPASI